MRSRLPGLAFAGQGALPATWAAGGTVWRLREIDSELMIVPRIASVAGAAPRFGRGGRRRRNAAGAPVRTTQAPGQPSAGTDAERCRSHSMHLQEGDSMPSISRLSLLGFMLIGLAACDDKQAQNNTPTKPDATKMEPQTDQSAPNPPQR